MPVSLNLPPGTSVRLARLMYEDTWAAMRDIGGAWADIAEWEESFYDSCTDDEWHEYVCARSGLSTDFG